MSQLFDTHTYHVQQSTKNNYAASPNFLETTSWQHTSTGLEVVDADEQPFTAIIVGRASAYRLKCGPGGNHFDSGLSPLEKAKYQFHLSRPANPELGADFTAGIKNLEELQKVVGKTGELKNMIIEDVTGKMLHCTRNVFTPRDEVIPDSPHGQRAENAPKMDDETKNWPIPDQFANEFDAIKYKAKAHPLPLYHDDHLVQPQHANEILNGAIVEVQFGIQHWHIKNIDTFQATPHKVTILKLGPIHVPSNYKRPNPSGDTDITGQPKSKKMRSSEA